MATNNRTLEVQNDAYTYSSNDSEAGALSATNRGVVVVENEVIGTQSARVNGNTGGIYERRGNEKAEGF